MDTTSVLALAGVLLAALVAGGLNASQSRQAAWLKAWVGLRLILSELADALAVAKLGAAESSKVEVYKLLPITTSAWEGSREAVAPFLGKPTWLDVDRAYSEIKALNRLGRIGESADSEALPDERRQPFEQAAANIEAARAGITKSLKGPKPSVRPGPWKYATAALWAVALLLVSLGIGVIGVELYHAGPWKQEPVTTTARDVAWSLEQQFQGDAAACEPVESTGADFSCTITTPGRNSVYALGRAGSSCALAAAITGSTRHTSSTGSGCNAKALVTEAPGSELIAAFMKTRSEITHPRSAPDEPVMVIRLFKAATHRLLRRPLPPPSIAH